MVACHNVADDYGLASTSDSHGILGSHHVVHRQGDVLVGNDDYRWIASTVGSVPYDHVDLDNESR
jgi:hypothetical protein